MAGDTSERRAESYQDHQDYEDCEDEDHKDERAPAELLAETRIGAELARWAPGTLQDLARGLGEVESLRELRWFQENEGQARESLDEVERLFHNVTEPWAEHMNGEAEKQHAARILAHAIAHPAETAAVTEERRDDSPDRQPPAGWEHPAGDAGRKILDAVRESTEMLAEGLIFDSHRRCARALELLREAGSDTEAMEAGATPHRFVHDLAAKDQPLARELSLSREQVRQNGQDHSQWTGGEDAAPRSRTIFETFQDSMAQMSQDFRRQSAHTLAIAMTRGLEADMKREPGRERGLRRMGGARPGPGRNPRLARPERPGRVRRSDEDHGPRGPGRGLPPEPQLERAGSARRQPQEVKTAKARGLIDLIHTGRGALCRKLYSAGAHWPITSSEVSHQALP